MKKLTLLLVIVLTLTCGSLFAQDDYPRAEVFGGFSLLNTDIGSSLSVPHSLYGFQANIAFNLDGYFGVEADFGGQFKSEGDVKVHIYEYMFGPRVALRQEKTTLFLHALWGGVNVGGGGYSNSDFTIEFGGGLDLNMNDRFALRVVQVDWIWSRFIENVGYQWYKDTVRFGFGIVIK